MKMGIWVFFVFVFLKTCVDIYRALCVRQLLGEVLCV